MAGAGCVIPQSRFEALEGNAQVFFPKIHIHDRGTLASIRPFDVETWERREVLGVQRGKDEMVCDGCGADEAI